MYMNEYVYTISYIIWALPCLNTGNPVDSVKVFVRVPFINISKHYANPLSTRVFGNPQTILISCVFVLPGRYVCNPLNTSKG